MLACRHVIIPPPAVPTALDDESGPAGGWRLRLVQPFVRRAAGVENPGAEGGTPFVPTGSGFHRGAGGVKSGRKAGIAATRRGRMPRAWREPAF